MVHFTCQLGQAKMPRCWLNTCLDVAAEAFFRWLTFFKMFVYLYLLICLHRLLAVALGCSISVAASEVLVAASGI